MGEFNIKSSNIKDFVKTKEDVIKIYLNLEEEYKELIKELKSSSTPKDLVSKLSQKELFNLIYIFNFFYYYEEPLIPDFVYEEILNYYYKKFNEESIEVFINPEKVPEENLKTLPKIYSHEEKKLKKQLKDMEDELVVMSKLDGVSCLLKDGRLYTKGRDLTSLIKYINLPKKNLRNDLTIRGELIIKKENIKHFDKNKNLRSQVIGLLGQKLDKDNPLLKYVELVAYQILNVNSNIIDKLELLSTLNFIIPKYQVIKKKDVTSLTLHHIFKEINEDFEIDGIVITNKKAVFRSSYNCFAFKNNDLVLKTKVLSITWNINDKLIYIPVINIEPVSFNKNVIKKVSGFNASFIVKNKIGKGAEITIKYIGNVIPCFNSLLTPSEEFNFPENYIWDENKKNILSPTDNLQSISLKIEKFYVIFNIKMIKHNTILKVLQFFQGKNIIIYDIFSYLKTVKEWFENQNRKETILGGIKDKTLQQSLLIFKEEKISVIKILSILNNFALLGESKLTNIFNNYKDVARIISEETDVSLIDEEILKKIKFIEEKTIKSFLKGAEYFMKKRSLFEQYFNISYLIVDEQKLKICFTKIKNKDERIKYHCNKFVECLTVTKTIDFLVVESLNDDIKSTKYENAKKYNIPIIDFHTFITKMRNI